MFRNYFALMLRDGRKNMNRQPRGLRHVASNEINTRFHEVGNEGDVTRQPVKMSNQQYGEVLAAFFERSKERWPVGVILPALDFGACKGLTVGGETGDGLLLRV